MSMHVWENSNSSFEEKICKKCHGKPSYALTDECPDRPLTKEEISKIREKELDFSGGRWKTYVTLPLH